jgi:UDP-N-acetylglucosamine diphosphorylase/glucosamine-1-phosphate N-acetyltransferase
MNLVVFEDSHWHDFAPFSLSRPVFSLATGMTSLLAKQIRHLRPTRLTLWVRPAFEDYCRQRIAPQTGVPTRVNVALDDEPTLLVNARLAFSQALESATVQGAESDEEQNLLAALVVNPGLSPADVFEPTRRWLALSKLPAMKSGAKLMQSPVDLIYWNEQSLMEDFAHLGEAIVPPRDGPYHLINAMDIRLGSEAVLSPGCVLDASKGPIALGAGASIGHNAVVQGPCWIGAGSVVTPLAIIRPGVSIGPMCKIGGEVSASIFIGCSNKSHEGFLGHSYIGEWVNLGAGTTTSNLKNTYGPITLHRGSQAIHTGRRFVGSLIGDHAKTAILTRLMGGSYIGHCSMLAGSAIAPRFVPSYQFITERGAEAYDRGKAIEVAQRVFTRRERAWTPIDEQIMNYVAETAPMVEG